MMSLSFSRGFACFVFQHAAAGPGIVSVAFVSRVHQPPYLPGPATGVRFRAYVAEGG